MRLNVSVCVVGDRPSCEKNSSWSNDSLDEGARNVPPSLPSTKYVEFGRPKSEVLKTFPNTLIDVPLKLMLAGELLHVVWRVLLCTGLSFLPTDQPAPYRTDGSISSTTTGVVELSAVLLIDMLPAADCPLRQRALGARRRNMGDDTRLA